MKLRKCSRALFVNGRMKSYVVGSSAVARTCPGWLQVIMYMEYSTRIYSLIVDLSEPHFSPQLRKKSKSPSYRYYEQMTVSEPTLEFGSYFPQLWPFTRLSELLYLQLTPTADWELLREAIHQDRNCKTLTIPVGIIGFYKCNIRTVLDKNETVLRRHKAQTCHLMY